MPKKHKKLGLLTKIFLTVLVPVLLLIYLSYDKIKIADERLKDLQSIEQKINEIAYISEVLHEIQIERDFASLYLQEATLESQNAFQNQIKVTDSIADLFKEKIIANESDSSLIVILESIQEYRNQTSWFQFSVHDAEFNYNRIVQEYLTQIAWMGAGSKIPETRTEINAYISLLWTKEYLGRIRTVLNRTFVNGRFEDMSEYGLFATHKGGFESSLQTFKKIAPQEIIDQFQTDFILTSGNMLKIMDYVFEHPQDERYLYESDSWWFRSTSTINVLHDLEVSSILRLQNIINSNINATKASINKSVYVLSGGILAVVVLMLYFLASVRRQITKIRKAAIEVAQGNTRIEVPVETEDAIGVLAESFNVIQKNADSLASVAEQIGKGDYEVEVPLRGNNDSLGLSIREMGKGLKQRSADLKKKVKELKESNQYKSAFLANISHELKTPLNSLLILAKVLRENASGNLPKGDLESIDVIIKNAEDLLLLIEDILDISKIEAGAIDIRMEPTSLNEVVTDLRELFLPISIKDEKEFEVSPLNEQVTIQTDGLRMGQILKNLLSNAFKFTEPGGKITLSVKEQSDGIEIQVSDTGVGISKDKQEAIFEAFQQADTDIGRKYGGTGLGLSISRELASKLDLELGLQSEKGKGSTFHIKIPKKLILDSKPILDQELGETSYENQQEEIIDTDSIAEPLEFKQPENQGYFHNDIDTSEYNFGGREVILFEPDITRVFEFSGAIMDCQLLVKEVDELHELENQIESNPIGLIVNLDEVDFTADSFHQIIDKFDCPVAYIKPSKDQKVLIKPSALGLDRPFSLKELLEYIKNS